MDDLEVGFASIKQLFERQWLENERLRIENEGLSNDLADRDMDLEEANQTIAEQARDFHELRVAYERLMVDRTAAF